jgi:hypothetical protein
MNTTQKLVVNISTLAIATAPAIASDRHLRKLSTNHPSVAAQQQKEGGGTAGKLVDPGVFSPAQMPGGLVPGTGAGGALGGPGVGLPTPQAGAPARVPVNIVDNTKGGLAGKGAFERPPIGMIVHYTDAVKGHAPNLEEMLDIGMQRGLYAQKFIDEQGVMHQLVPEGQISYHAKGGFKEEGRANFLYEGVEIASIHGAKNPNLTTPAANEVQMATLTSYYYQQKEAAEAAGRSYAARGHNEIPGNADRINEGAIEARILRSGVGKPVVADQGAGLRP